MYIYIYIYIYICIYSPKSTWNDVRIGASCFIYESILCNLTYSAKCGSIHTVHLLLSEAPEARSNPNPDGNFPI